MYTSPSAGHASARSPRRRRVSTLVASLVAGVYQGVCGAAACGLEAVAGLSLPKECGMRSLLVPAAVRGATGCRLCWVCCSWWCACESRFCGLSAPRRFEADALAGMAFDALAGMAYDALAGMSYDALVGITSCPCACRLHARCARWQLLTTIFSSCEWQLH